MDKPTQITPPPDTPSPEVPALDLTGRVLDDFKVLRRLGQGGMGQVYLAEQISLKRKVALKILRPDLVRDRTSLQRFKAEAEAVARVTHANIVQVYAFDQCEGLPYMALEYVEGRNLAQYLSRKGPPEVLLALSIMRQAAAALQRASELGIIHRDIKPENILLTRKGEVKVADFGLSRCLVPEGQPLNLTQSGVTMGTPLYMSPEQVQGKPLDARTDIYSLGVTCYHMLAGQPPFRGTSPFDVALQHVQAEAAPLHRIRPDLPPDLCAIVHKMMAKDPDQRYQTCRDLNRDLARLREALAVGSALPPLPAISVDAVSLPAGPTVTAARNAITMTSAAVPPARRGWLALLVALSMLLALGGGAGAAWLLRHGGMSPTSTAPAASAEETADEPLLTLQKREQVLKDAAELYAVPKDSKEVPLGVGRYMELGVFYLEQNRWDDADKLFKRLASEGQEVRPYRYLGNLGHAVVLGLKNQTRESNEALTRLLDPKVPLPGADPAAFLRKNPKLHQWVATALDYNLANQSPAQPFPENLERFRHPNLQGSPRPGGDKPPNKKP